MRPRKMYHLYNIVKHLASHGKTWDGQMHNPRKREVVSMDLQHTMSYQEATT